MECTVRVHHSVCTGYSVLCMHLLQQTLERFTGIGTGIVSLHRRTRYVCRVPYAGTVSIIHCNIEYRRQVPNLLHNNNIMIIITIIIEMILYYD